jgi:CDP-diacylglycerol--inositol 3-phosphatidyltransferase
VQYAATDQNRIFRRKQCKMTGDNIFIFVPNIIGKSAPPTKLDHHAHVLGYARVVLALISFYYMPTNYVAAVICYVTSALLDAFDGHAAR